MILAHFNNDIIIFKFYGEEMYYLKNKICIVLVCFTLVLTGCSKPAHEPLVGEYGESKIFSQDLSIEYINKINASAEPNPKDLDTLMIDGFDIIAKKSPYRVVLVARGKVIKDGSVKMRWLGGIDAVAKAPNPPAQVGMGGLLESTDSKKYSAGESVLLVMVGGKVQPSIDRPATIQLNLVRRENIVIDSIRLEVWQGKGKIWSFWDKFFWFSLFTGPVLLWVGIRSRRR